MADLQAVADAHRIRARHEFRGLRTAEHYFTVPLDHGLATSAVDGQTTGETITVFAREYSSTEYSAEEARQTSVAAVPPGWTRRTREPRHFPLRLDEGSGQGFSDPDAGPARHRPFHSGGAAVIGATG
ncbi:hypothetical protein StoSoilB13_07280 [Arthrobacter sp. StoSoilB13]|nr:hypothetical protein StoSoilB13_07280 [Arthrobacter sp. StoSoilB13]